MLRTCGADGKHQWCEVLNTIQFITDMKSTYCNKQAILPTANQNYMTRNIYPRQILQLKRRFRIKEDTIFFRRMKVIGLSDLWDYSFF